MDENEYRLSCETLNTKPYLVIVHEPNPRRSESGQADPSFLRHPSGYPWPSSAWSERQWSSGSECNLLSSSWEVTESTINERIRMLVERSSYL